MTAEQQGVSPATAGGASAPGPWDIGHSPATGGRNLYVRDADGDVYVGVIFEPADARRIVEAMNAAERPRLAAPDWEPVLLDERHEWWGIRHIPTARCIARWDGTPARWTSKALAEQDAAALGRGETATQSLDILAASTEGSV